MDTDYTEKGIRSDTQLSLPGGATRLLEVEFGVLFALLVPPIAMLCSFDEIRIGPANYLAVMTVGLPAVAAGLLLIKAGLDPSRLRFWPGHWSWLIWLFPVWGSLLWTEAAIFPAVKCASEYSTPYLFGLLGAMFVRTEATLRLLLYSFLFAIVPAGFCVLLWLGGVVECGEFVTGPALAARPHSMSLLPVAAVALAFLGTDIRPALVVWSASIVICGLEGSRGAALCILVLPLFHPGVRGILWRGAAIVLMMIMAYAVFLLPPMQRRLFPKTGSGTISDLLNSKASGTGRFDAWPLVYEQILDRPFFGHGIESARFYIPTIWPRMESPHNELLRVGYETGLWGVTVFVAVFVGHVFWLRSLAKRASGTTSIALSACFLSFFGFMMLALTDNPLASNVRLLNPVFCLMGAALSIQASSKTSKQESIENA